jgi:60 kDa SS-A/Ro ribonucleoprotein
MTPRKLFSTRQTPQHERIPGTAQRPNSAGGFAWAVDDWTRLDRFLILGSEGGTYYIGERQLTVENAEAVLRCLQADGERVVRRVVAVSAAGRAPKNDPALFVLAMAAGRGDPATRRAALAALPRVARIGTHLLHFAAYVEGFRGWGRGLRQAIAAWYTAMPADRLAYQTVKYRQRDGWSQRDLLRLAHPAAPTEQHQILFHWLTKGWEGVGEAPHPDPALQIVWAFERAQRVTDERELVSLIRDYRLPREAVPTEWLDRPAVWEALLEEMPMTALIRNLATLTRIGLLTPTAATTRRIVDQVSDGPRLRAARVHPIALLAALKTYAGGKGVRGQQTWTPVQAIVDALDSAFHAAFAHVEPTGQRWLLGVDVSGSMSAGTIGGVPGVTPRVAAAAMALLIATTEQRHTIMAFQDRFVPLPISPRQRLDDAVKLTDGLPFGGTDCALPMLWALEQKAEVDVFAVLTDSETWAGNVHPTQALQRYREKTGIPARLIVVGMTSNGFTIADPNDAGMLDVVGFDTAAPTIMADFARGTLLTNDEEVA